MLLCVLIAIAVSLFVYYFNRAWALKKHICIFWIILSSYAKDGHSLASNCFFVQRDKVSKYTIAVQMGLAVERTHNRVFLCGDHVLYESIELFCSYTATVPKCTGMSFGIRCVVVDCEPRVLRVIVAFCTSQCFGV